MAMNKESFPKLFRYLALFGAFLLCSFYIISATGVRAANIGSASDTLTTTKINTAANHTISFRSSSGISSGTLVVNLQNIVSSIGSVDYTDVDLTYGNQDATLDASAGVNTWGVSVASTGQITFTYPTACTSPCSAITSGATVTIKIGTHASGGNAQLVNHGTAGSKYVSIVSGSDRALFAVALLTNPTASVSGNVEVPTGTTSVSSAPASSTTTTTAPSSTPAETAPTTPASTSDTTTATTPTSTTTTTAPSSTPAETAPTAPVLQAPLASPATGSVDIPAATNGSGLATVVGALNTVTGGGGLSASIASGTFLTAAGKPAAARVRVTPMSFLQSLEWTGCSAVLKQLNVVGGAAYGFSAENSAAKNAGDVNLDYAQSVTFTLSYSQADIEDQGIIEDSISVIAFDPEDCNQPVTFTLDTANKAVTVITKPKTFFALVGDVRSGFVKKPATPPTFEITPAVSDISLADLNATDTLTNEDAGISNGQLQADKDATIDICLASTLFKKPVKRIYLTVAANTTRLAYDEARDCFAGSIKAPSTSGKKPVTLKIIYVDDQVQIITLSMVITSDFEKNLLNFALPLIEQFRLANEQVAKAVEQTQPLLQTAAAVTVPVVGVANPALVTNALNWYYYLNHFFSWLLSLLGIRKKRKQWGVVYNSISKSAIDLVIVRLFDKATNRLIETQVTDKQGRFSFLAVPGNYYITATKNPFEFPSKIVRGTIDGDFSHIYRQESFIVAGPDQQMTMSIPLDPPAFDHVAAAQSVSLIKWWKTFVGKNPLAPLIVGFIIAELLTLYIPNSLNYTLLGLNGFFVLTQIILGIRPERAWGLVFDVRTLAPVPLAAITIFDAKDGKLLRTRLSDYFGRFSFLTPPGEYMLAVMKDQYLFPAPKDTHNKYRHLYFGEKFSVKKKNSLVKANIPLVPQSESPIPETMPVPEVPPQQQNLPEEMNAPTLPTAEQPSTQAQHSQDEATPEQPPISPVLDPGETEHNLLEPTEEKPPSSS